MPQSDPSFLAELATGLAGIATAISAWAWKHTHGLIGRKAEASALEQMMARFDRAFQDQREDNRRIFDNIERVTRTHSDFAEKIAAELGKRPTREECQVFWHPTHTTTRRG